MYCTPHIVQYALYTAHCTVCHVLHAVLSYSAHCTYLLASLVGKDVRKLAANMTRGTVLELWGGVMYYCISEQVILFQNAATESKCYKIAQN